MIKQMRQQGAYIVDIATRLVALNGRSDATSNTLNRQPHPAVRAGATFTPEADLFCVEQSGEEQHHCV